jgi:hypothetical protein
VASCRFRLNGSGSGSDVLQAARVAHQAWRARLRPAIETGTSSISAQDAGRDDACSFGKWLHGPGTFGDREPATLAAAA